MPGSTESAFGPATEEGVMPVFLFRNPLEDHFPEDRTSDYLPCSCPFPDRFPALSGYPVQHLPP